MWRFAPDIEIHLKNKRLIFDTHVLMHTILCICEICTKIVKSRFQYKFCTYKFYVYTIVCKSVYVTIITPEKYFLI